MGDFIICEKSIGCIICERAAYKSVPFEKKIKINTYTLILKQCYNASTPLRVPDSQSPLASACMFDSQQSCGKLLGVLELAHFPEH